LVILLKRCILSTAAISARVVFSLIFDDKSQVERSANRRFPVGDDVERRVRASLVFNYANAAPKRRKKETFLEKFAKFLLNVAKASFETRRIFLFSSSAFGKFYFAERLSARICQFDRNVATSREIFAFDVIASRPRLRSIAFALK